MNQSNAESVTAAQRTPLPLVEPLGRVSPRFCKLYSKEHGIFLKTHADNGGDKPTLWIDLEHSEWGPELHLAVTQGWRKEAVRESGVKNDSRLDIYIPASEISKLLSALVQANLRQARPKKQEVLGRENSGT